MREDIWVSVEEAIIEMKKRPDAHHAEVKSGRLCIYNKHGGLIESRRIFDGTEHPLARKDMVCF